LARRRPADTHPILSQHQIAAPSVHHQEHPRRQTAPRRIGARSTRNGHRLAQVHRLVSLSPARRTHLRHSGTERPRTQIQQRGIHPIEIGDRRLEPRQLGRLLLETPGPFARVVVTPVVQGPGGFGRMAQQFFHFRPRVVMLGQRPQRVQFGFCPRDPTGCQRRPSFCNNRRADLQLQPHGRFIVRVQPQGPFQPLDGRRHPPAAIQSFRLPQQIGRPLLAGLNVLANPGHLDVTVRD
jgi:hypothetical protein